MEAKANPAGIPTTENGQPMYEIVTDKQGTQYRIANLENEDFLPKTGIIELEAFKTRDYDRLRDTTYRYRCTRDKITEVFWGIFTGFHKKTGDLMWLPIDLGILNTFDLSVPIERKKALCLLKSSIVEGSPNLSQRHLMFRVIDKEKAALLEIKRFKDGRRALNIAEGLFGEELINMARNLGITMVGSSTTMIEAAVLKRAEQNPKEFLAVWENPHRTLLTILNRSMESGVVSFDVQMGYNFQGHNFAHNEYEAIQFLIKHPDIAQTMDIRSQDKMSAQVKAMAKETKNVIGSDDKDSIITLLQKQLEEEKKRNATLAAANIKKNIEEDESKMVEWEREMTELKKRGSELKMKGLHLFKTEEQLPKLREKIAEAEAKLQEA